jgi:4-amino-4-deoxychorismate lyase
MTLAILVNGHAPADLGHAIAANDRGLHYGDGVFETALLIDGQVRFLDDHLKRLRESCERLSIRPPDPATLAAEITRVTGALHSGVLKIIITRGAGTRGYRPAHDVEATRIVALYAAPESPSSSGITLRWCDTRLGRNARLAGVKHLNRLEQVLAQAEWQDASIDDGLMLDTEGELVCATAGNVFIVREGALATPDLRFCGVRGIMRTRVLRAAAQLRIPASEEPLWPHDVEIADEVFLTNAIRGIRQVVALGSLQWSHGPVVERLKAAMEL